MKMTQKQLEESLSIRMQQFYGLLKGFVREGNCLIHTQNKTRQIKKVKLATGKQDNQVRGLVFTT